MANPQKWVCSYCGTRTTCVGRPMPGQCVRKPRDKNGKMKPHTWVKDNR